MATIVELHVWNRAFGLPSLDPECLAAIAFLSTAIPQDLWVLVESNNINLSPNGALPALKDGSRWIGGFDSIVSYLSSRSSGRSDIDRNLSRIQKAEAVAYRSFIRQTCLPIISLSLYITSRNWVQVTRPLYSTFIQFPIQYEIPHSHHARAISTTSHLTSLIRDLAAEEHSSPIEPISAAIAGITTSTTKTKSSDTKETEKITTRVKLRNFVADFVDPIREKLNRRNYFFGGNSPTTVDCLLVGYLSLLVYPDLPSSWAKEIMQQEFADVILYVENLKSVMLAEDGVTHAEADEADKLTFGSWVKGGLENVPQKWGWVDSIPLRESDRIQQSSSFWVILQGILGVAAAAGGVLAYKTLVVGGDVEIEVEEKIGEAATAGVNEFVDVERVDNVDRLPIFRAEDMLNLNL
ncbi:Metaxin-1 [Arthrobotrys entomopaga]|nr:Metaxin-1 [Arthrobotrys entomopaga]